MATHSSIPAGEFHGQRSLAGYSPWGRKELDTTKSEASKQSLKGSMIQKARMLRTFKI